MAQVWQEIQLGPSFKPFKNKFNERMCRVPDGDTVGSDECVTLSHQKRSIFSIPPFTEITQKFFSGCSAPGQPSMKPGLWLVQVWTVLNVSNNNKKEFMSEQFLKVACFLTGVELTGFYKDNDCNLLPIPQYCLPPTSLLNSTAYYQRSHSHACKTSTLEKNIDIMNYLTMNKGQQKKQITFKLIENTSSIESQMQSSPSFSTTLFSLAFLICIEMWKYEKPPRKTSFSSFDTYF